METNDKLNNGSKAIVWQNLTRILKEGDTVYSPFGEGRVISINYSDIYPILVEFNGGKRSFTKLGFIRHEDEYPSVTNIPYNPLTDPFPTPMFEPIVGEWYAFWDDNIRYFIVDRLRVYNKGVFKFISNNSYTYSNCAPIEEALELFKAKFNSHE